MPAPTLSRSRSPRAFTLIELLVVISIIALLIGILLPALGNARETAKQIKALSANRQLLVGYTAYQNDYDGHVMFGYPPALVDGEPFKVRLPSGHTFSSDVDLAFPIVRYPARMAEYQGHAWEILYDHIPPSDRPSSSDTQQQAWSKLYNLSVFPSFGINATYVGGDDHGKHGFVGDKPNRGKHVVFKQVEVRRASGLIVFADAIQRGGGIASGVNGYHLATPPRANGPQWHAQGSEIILDNTSALLGVPVGRYGATAVTGFFDGHAGAHSPTELDDMRLWNNFAQAADDDYTP